MHERACRSDDFCATGRFAGAAEISGARIRALDSCKPRIGGDEQRDGRHTQRRRQMHHTGIDAADEVGASKQRGKPGKAAMERHERALDAGCEDSAARGLVATAPWEYYADAGAGDVLDQRTPLVVTVTGNAISSNTYGIYAATGTALTQSDDTFTGVTTPVATA